MGFWNLRDIGNAVFFDGNRDHGIVHLTTTTGWLGWVQASVLRIRGFGELNSMFYINSRLTQLLITMVHRQMALVTHLGTNRARCRATILTCCLRVRHRLGNDPQTGCSDCACHEAGTLPGETCRDKNTGQCPCKSNVKGTSCNQCRSDTFNLTHDNPDGCQPCNCDVTGTDGSACDQNTGQCSCLSNRIGTRCDTCKPRKP